MLLKTGSRGDAVAAWQSFLNTQGFDVGTADGIFGANTDAATRAFQSAHGLTADGIAGPATFAKAAALGYRSGSSTFPPQGDINVVVDISRFQSTVDFNRVKADGILGVIAKATEGYGYTDPTYLERQPKALEAGLLWGAYHFGTGTEVQQQLDWFLGVVKPGPDTLLVLDWEENHAGTQMTLEQAEEFVNGVHLHTGRCPVLYGGNLIKQSVGTGNDVLRNCPLWLSQYGSTPTLPGGWSEYTMWQYTNGTDGPEPHSVAGIGNCDRDTYKGTASELQTFWKSGL